MEELYLRLEEYEQLKQRLEELERQRLKVAQEIAEARSQRDLSENAAYIAAKEKQAFLEGEIAGIRRRLQHVRIIEEDEGKPSVSVEVRPGSRVRLVDLKTSEELKVVLVSDLSLNLGEDLLPVSPHSPLGKALLGQSPGQRFSVQTPRGVQQYQILEVF